MEGDFRKDVFTIAVGTFLGAMLAHSLGYLWYLGVACGGFMGYLSRLLTEPQAITYAGKRAWQVAKQLHLPENWWERVKSGFYDGTCIGGPTGVLMGVVLVLSNNLEPRGRAAADLGVNSSLDLYILSLFSVSLLCALLISILFLFDGATYEFHHGRRINWKKWAIQLNPISIHLFAIYYTVLGLAYCVSYALWSLVWAIVHVPDFFIGMWRLLVLSACFVKLFSKFVHAEKFTACGVYASLGSFLVFILIPNNPLAIIVSSMVFGYIGARARHFLLPRLNGSLVVK